jgi:hypothetical protein
MHRQETEPSDGPGRGRTRPNYSMLPSRWNLTVVRPAFPPLAIRYECTGACAHRHRDLRKEHPKQSDGGHRCGW